MKKLAGNPQAVARLAADAKKLMDDKTTKGGVALSGKVCRSSPARMDCSARPFALTAWPTP